MKALNIDDQILNEPKKYRTWMF